MIVGPRLHGLGSIPKYEFTIVYRDRGFFLAAEELYEPPAIKPYIAISSWVVFFSPTAQGLGQAYDGGQISANLVSWQGYQDFMSYCRQVQAAEYSGSTCQDTFFGGYPLATSTKPLTIRKEH